MRPTMYRSVSAPFTNLAPLWGAGSQQATFSPGKTRLDGPLLSGAGLRSSGSSQAIAPGGGRKRSPFSELLNLLRRRRLGQLPAFLECEFAVGGVRHELRSARRQPFSQRPHSGFQPQHENLGQHGVSPWMKDNPTLDIEGYAPVLSRDCDPQHNLRGMVILLVRSAVSSTTPLPMTMRRSMPIPRWRLRSMGALESLRPRGATPLSWFQFFPPA